MNFKETPISDFGKRLLQDFPSITKSEVRDITFNLLRSAATVSQPGGSSNIAPDRPKAVRVLQDRQLISAKRPAPAVRNEPLPAAQPTGPINIANIPYRSPQEGLDRRYLLPPARPYAGVPTPPWELSPTPPDAHRPAKIPKIY